VGHTTVAATLDTYGHLFPDSEDLGRGAVVTRSEMPWRHRNGTSGPGNPCTAGHRFGDGRVGL
jgi:hypothetical protein